MRCIHAFAAVLAVSSLAVSEPAKARLCKRWRGLEATFVPPSVRRPEARSRLSRLEVIARTAVHQDDLYNGVLWMLGTGSVHAWVNPPRQPRWRSGILFDDDFRGGLRISSASGRKTADHVSTGLLLATASAPLILDAGLKTGFLDGNCDGAFELAAEWMESIALTLFVTEATKVLVGRERPFADRCGPSAPPDAACGGDGRRRSFFSGHASIAAAGAGLLCASSVRRKTWGESTFQRATPCALGVAAAVATGILRVAADEHWSTDVIAGWAIGGLIGYFDLPGPVDLFRFAIDRGPGEAAIQGLVLPSLSPGSLGLRVSMRF